MLYLNRMKQNMQNSAQYILPRSSVIHFKNSYTYRITLF